MSHNAFVPKEHKAHLNSIIWDKYYIDRELKKVAKKTGDGDEDYVIVAKVVETKRSIKETIDAQADDVGLNNILKKFALTGDESLLPERAVVGDEIIDMSKLPQDLIEADNFYKQQKAMFDSLPAEITKGRSFTEFMTNFNQAEFDAYVAALAAANKAKEKPEEGGND